MLTHDISSAPTVSPSSTVNIQPKCSLWDSNFDINWDDMPYGIKQAIMTSTRPSMKDRKIMIRKLVDNMKKYSANPTLAQVSTIARKMCYQYPECFQDRIDNVCMGSGYASIAKQIKSRFDHLNRGNVDVRLRAKKGAPSMSGTKYYGCINYRPLMPIGETDDSIEEHRLKMIDLFASNGPIQTNEIERLMTNTYYGQRQVINSSSGVADLQTKWPYMFVPKNVLNHFSTLTGTSANALESAINTRGACIVNYLRESKKPSVKEVLLMLPAGECESKTVETTMLLILAEFNEPVESMFLLKDVSTTADDYDMLLKL